MLRLQTRRLSTALDEGDVALSGFGDSEASLGVLFNDQPRTLQQPKIRQCRRDARAIGHIAKNVALLVRQC